MFELETERFGKVRVVFEHIQQSQGFVQESYDGTYCFIEPANKEIDFALLTHPNALSGGRSYLAAPDQFDKSRGRKIAFTRALEGLGATREERTQFWQAYWDAIKDARIKARNDRIDKKIDKNISELGYDL
jgi:hypothetical protein